MPVVHLGVAKLHQRVQRAAHRGARQIDELGDIAERELLAVLIERLDDAQSARQRFEKFRARRFDQCLLGGEIC